MAISRNEFGSEDTIHDWLKIFPGSTFLQLNAIHGKLWMTLLAASLIWPEFREESGAIVIKEQTAEHTVEKWMSATNGDVTAVERVINTVHLWDRFPNEAESADPALGQLAQLLAETWSAKLRIDYPEYTFVVAVSLDPDIDYGPTVTFWRDSP